MKHSQPTLIQSLLILAIATLVLLWCIVKANISTGISLLYAASICALIAVGLGRRWEEMFDNILEMVGKALPSMFILLLAGLINASWIASGTIPLLIAYGLKLLKPKIIPLNSFRPLLANKYGDRIQLGHCIFVWFGFNRYRQRTKYTSGFGRRSHCFRLFFRWEMVSPLGQRQFSCGHNRAERQ